MLYKYCTLSHINMLSGTDKLMSQYMLNNTSYRHKSNESSHRIVIESQSQLNTPSTCPFEPLNPHSLLMFLDSVCKFPSYILIFFLALTSCVSYNSEIIAIQKISDQVQNEWYGRKDVACIDYSKEIQKRCRELGIEVKQVTVLKDAHRALLYHEGNVVNDDAVVIDSTGAMSSYPVKLGDLEKVTGYKFHKIKLGKGERYERTSK